MKAQTKILSYMKSGFATKQQKGRDKNKKQNKISENWKLLKNVYKFLAKKSKNSWESLKRFYF